MLGKEEKCVKGRVGDNNNTAFGVVV